MKISLYFVCLFFLYSCNVKTPVTYVDIEKIPLIEVKTDTVKMNEVLRPLSMYPFKEWLILINMDSDTGTPLFIYDTDSLKFCFTAGKSGRGPGEFFYINPYYFYKTDTSFLINTNHFLETEISVYKDSIKVGKSKVILDSPANNLLKINDSLFFFENKMKQFEYSIYNANKKRNEKDFSDFPTSKISCQANDDRDNIYQKTCLYQKDKKSIVSFYLNIPLVRIYDDQYKLVKEIKLKNIEESPLTMEEFYNDKGNLYFSCPYSTDSKIYVLFDNETLASTYQSSDSELQVWNWNGELEKRYHFACKFDIFTISDDGQTLYGLNTQEENFYFIKAVLE